MGRVAEYDIIEKLGQGAYGIVYKVRWKKDNRIFVMKQINISKMNRKNRQEAENEVKILHKSFLQGLHMY